MSCLAFDYKVHPHVAITKLINSSSHEEAVACVLKSGRNLFGWWDSHERELFNISTASHRCCADKRWSFANTSVWTIVQAVNTNYDRRWSNEAFGSHKKFIGCSRTFASQSLSSLTSTEFGSGSKRAPSHMSFSRMQMQTDRSRQESSLMLFERRIESLILTQR